MRGCGLSKKEASPASDYGVAKRAASRLAKILALRKYACAG